MNNKILIVDDDEYIRDLYKEVLEELNYKVDLASDGEQGYTKIISNQYDLVLLDVMMPKIDGIGVLRKVASLTEKLKVGKIVLLTNLEHDPIIQEGISLGAKGYLIKADMTPDVLIQKVAGLLAS